jgi:hypothetical protein
VDLDAVWGLFGLASPTASVGAAASAGVAFVLGGLVAAALLLFIDLRRMVNRDYGLCTGFERVPGAAHPPLTEWLHGLIQEIAGRQPGEAPLTFYDLATAPGSPRDTLGDASPPSAVSINLQMYTANLTHGRPYVFPQQRILPSAAEADAALDKGEQSPLYFRPRELRPLFPAAVIEYMKTDPVTGASNRYAGPVRPQEPRRKDPFWERWSPSRSRAAASADDDEALWRLPRKHLPIVVAARMSVSFPVLFAGVPLWAMERREQAGRPGQRDRSSGGAASDGSSARTFPSLFDSWVPAWPTFGISLHGEVPVPLPTRPVGTSGRRTTCRAAGPRRCPTIIGRAGTIDGTTSTTSPWRSCACSRSRTPSSRPR